MFRDVEELEKGGHEGGNGVINGGKSFDFFFKSSFFKAQLMYSL